MASQGFLFGRTLLTSRFSQLLQVSGLRTKATDKLKALNIPDRPRRPLTPYFRFAQDHRETVMKQHPEWKITDVSKEVAKEWKQVHPTVKEKYEIEYRQELEDYAVNYTTYSKRLTEEQKLALKNQQEEVKEAKLKKKRKKRMKELNKPKRPMGAYFLFVLEQSKAQEKNYKEAITYFKDKWASLDQTEKDKYVEAAVKARSEYEEELKSWEWRMIEEGNVDLVRKNTLEGKFSTKKAQKKKKDY